MSKIAFIGLGVMGEPMARNLLKAGHNVRTYDVQDKVLDRIASEGAEIASSPADSVIIDKAFPHTGIFLSPL